MKARIGHHIEWFSIAENIMNVITAIIGFLIIYGLAAMATNLGVVGG